MNKRMVIFLFSLLLLIGCNGNKIKRNTELEKDINSSIIMVSDNSESEVNIKDLANFEWDKAFLINPYTPQEEIEKQVGVNFKDPSNISSRDDIYLLIFLNNGKVVQYAEINRLQTSFNLADKEYLTPSNDLMNIKR
ncbi:hypothetical protein ACFFF5_07025 [Lederbergia wuyishanensis]|uniref:Lipoprotein n=1 Tax=Lederbergia wuyishanensis TaxID=1347903 RepID=A0ABU0D2H1_9BACI|nr:hypothetical protein [Lederbergia wuyishanensis]MCJ8007241.1 hypothetical protein [Lederbergia wuyishanensis]MDQ0342608.1 hypothetical protein [Lederbergia wuyishanensis]